MTIQEKQIQMQFGMFKVLTDLLLDTINDPVKVPTKETKALIDALKMIEPQIEKLNEKFNTDAGRRSTFFIDLQNKIMYNFKKAYEL
jgi:hypothetical protein